MPSRSGINANFGNFSRDIQRMSDNFLTEVKDLVEHTLGEIEMNSIRDAPGGGDLIKTESGTETQADIRGDRPWVAISQAIGYKINSGGYSGEVFIEKSAGEISVWTEMGTGQSARSYLQSVPSPWRALAQLFYINGQGSIVAQPYFLPNILRQEIAYKKEMKELLKRQRP